MTEDTNWTDAQAALDHQAKQDLIVMLGLHPDDVSFVEPSEQHSARQPRRDRHAPSSKEIPLPQLDATPARALRLWRSSAFEPREMRFIAAYSKALGDLAQTPETFRAVVLRSLTSTAIARVLSDEVGETPRDRDVDRHVPAFTTILDFLREVAISTYEGQPIHTNVVIGTDGKPGDHSILLDHYQDRGAYPWYPALGASRSTAICVDKFARVTGIEDLNEPTLHPDNAAWYPAELARLAAYSRVHRTPAFSIQHSGDIAVLISGELTYAFRRGSWRAFPRASLSTRRLAYPGVNDAILEALVDASFNRHGATIAIVEQARLPDFEEACRLEPALVQPKNRWDLEPAEHRDVRARLIARGSRSVKFHELSRDRRLELLNMDGATIVLSDGTLIAAGAIVSVPGGGGGGRRAAAQRLSHYGSAFKVSQDGAIELFRADGTNAPSKPVVTLG